MWPLGRHPSRRWPTWPSRRWSALRAWRWSSWRRPTRSTTWTETRRPSAAPRAHLAVFLVAGLTRVTDLVVGGLGRVFVFGHGCPVELHRQVGEGLCECVPRLL